MFCGGLFAGRIFDSHGPRWLLAGGSTLFIVCFFVIPECKEYWQFFLAQGVAFGISISTMYHLPVLSLMVASFRPLLALITGFDENGLLQWASFIPAPLSAE